MILVNVLDTIADNNCRQGDESCRFCWSAPAYRRNAVYAAVRPKYPQGRSESGTSYPRGHSKSVSAATI